MNYIHEIIKNEEQIPINIKIKKQKSFFIMQHWHSDIELTYITSGKIDMIYIDGVEYTAKKGDFFLINSNSVHSISVKYREDNMGVTFLIPYKFLEKVYPDIQTIIFNCMSFLEHSNEKDIQFNELRSVLNEMIEVYEKREELWNLKIVSLSYELVYLLLKNFKTDKNKLEIIKSNENLEKVSIVCDHIKKNYNKSLTVNEIANKYCYSVQYLSRYFKNHTGMTISQYINNIRLQNAYRDLVNTDNSITFISFENGFPNEKSFTRVFKTVYGETPCRYRKEVHDKNRIN